MMHSSFSAIGEARTVFYNAAPNAEVQGSQFEGRERRDSQETLDPNKDATTAAKDKAAELQNGAVKKMNTLAKRTKTVETDAEKLRKLSDTDDIVTGAKDATVIGLLTPDAHTKPNTEATALETASVKVSAGDRAKAERQEQEQKEKVIAPESPDLQTKEQTNTLG